RVQKAILELGGAPLLVRPGPGARYQPLGPGYRPRVESAEGELVAEFVLLVGDDQYVVADALVEARGLRLDREMAGIGLPRPRHEGPWLFLDDPRLKFRRGVTDVGGEFAVAIVMADDLQQVRPALEDQILNQRVGQHRPARQQMENVGAAV